MALENIKKTINLSAISTINGESVVQFYAGFDSENIDMMVPSRSVLNNTLYRANREMVMVDQEAFEDQAYALLDEMTKTNTTTATEEASTSTK